MPSKWREKWEGTSIIIKTEGDFPDDDETSDHRPVKGIFNIDIDWSNWKPKSLKSGFPFLKGTSRAWLVPQ